MTFDDWVNEDNAVYKHIRERLRHQYGFEVTHILEVLPIENEPVLPFQEAFAQLQQELEQGCGAILKGPCKVDGVFILLSSEEDEVLARLYCA